MYRYLILCAFVSNIMAAESGATDSDVQGPASDCLHHLERMLRLPKTAQNQGERGTKRKADPYSEEARKKANLHPQNEGIIAEAGTGLVYYHFDEKLIEQSLAALDTLRGDLSYDRNFVIGTDADRESAFKLLEESGLKGLVTLVKEAIEVVDKIEVADDERKPLFLVLRVDPNCDNMASCWNRKNTQDWHDHGGADSYIFALTTSDNLTTMIKHDDVEKHIKKNALFLLQGSRLHRAPSAAPGKRIQFSIGLGSAP